MNNSTDLHLEHIVDCSDIFHNKEFEEWLEEWEDNFATPQDKEYFKNVITEWKKEWIYNENEEYKTTN